MEKIDNPEKVLEMMATLQAERYEISEENKLLRKENEELKKAQQSRTDEEKAEVEKLKASVEQLTNTMKAATTDCTEKDKQIQNLMNSNNSLVVRNRQLASENEELRASSKATPAPDTAKFEKEIESLKNSIDAAKKENETLKRENEEVKRGKEKADEYIKTLTSKKDVLANEVSKLKSELEKAKSTPAPAPANGNNMDGMKHALDNANARIKDLEMKLQQATEKWKALQEAPRPEAASGNSNVDTERVSKLEKLAYTDVKTGVKNNNALNERLNQADSHKVIFGMTGICGMKKINDKYGKRAGDACIKNVADKLSAGFGVDHVYRIAGDQFAVMFENNEFTYADVFGLISDIQKELKAEDIDITFGVADGIEFRTFSGIIEAVENQMKQFRGTMVDASAKQWTSPKVEIKAPEKPKVEAVPEEELLAKALGLQ